MNINNSNTIYMALTFKKLQLKLPFDRGQVPA